jgi:predicted transcriptional regulator
MEVAVNATIKSPAPSILTDEKLIAALKKRGPLTIEEMTSVSGMSWTQIFFAIDRLSRSGAVSLRKIGLAYQVAYNRAMLAQPASYTKASTAAETPLRQA